MAVDASPLLPLISTAGSAVGLVLTARLSLLAAKYALKRIRSAMDVRLGRGPNVAAARRRASQYARDRVRAESRRRRG